MGNSIKCCIACMLPCGALDVVRVLHANGHVEEYSRPVKAGEVMKANPKHVLGLPNYEGLVHKTVVLSPETELQRGKIYFLIPTRILHKHRGVGGGGHKSDSHSNKSKPPAPQNRPSASRVLEKKVPKPPLQSQSSGSMRAKCSSEDANVKYHRHSHQSEAPKETLMHTKQGIDGSELVISEQCLANVVCENEEAIKTQKDVRQCYQPRRRPEGSRSIRTAVGVWKPSLDSISEAEPL